MMKNITLLCIGVLLILPSMNSILGLEIKDEFTSCEKGICSYSSNGPYFTEFSKVEYQDERLTISYKDYSITLEPTITVNTNFYSKEYFSYNNIEFNIPVEKQGSRYKFALDLKNISQIVKDKGNNIGLKIVDYKNINLNDIKIDNEKKIITVKDIIIDFSDIIESNYSVDIESKTQINIGSINGKDSLYLDPTILLNTTTGLNDTYIYEGSATTNYGSENDLLFITYGGTRKKSLLNFNVSSIQSGSTINSALLYLYVTGWSGSSSSISVYQVFRNWVETETTWNNATTSIGWDTVGCENITTDRNATAEASTTIISINAWYNWNITILTQRWLSGISTNNGMILIDTSGSRTVNAVSSNAGSNNPYMQIIYTLPIMIDTKIDLYLNGTLGNVYYQNQSYANFTSKLNTTGYVNLTTNITGFIPQYNKLSPYTNISQINCDLNNTYYNITSWFNSNATHTASSSSHYAICWFVETTTTTIPTTTVATTTTTIEPTTTTVATTTTTTTTTLNSDLIGYYKFESDSRDYSIYGNNGTDYNSPTVVTGRVGNAYKFEISDQDYVDITYPIFNNLKQSTYSFWIKVNDSVEVGPWRRLLYKDKRMIEIQNTTTNPKAIRFLMNYAIPHLITCNNVYEFNEWVYITITNNMAYGYNTSKIFINGVECDPYYIQEDTSISLDDSTNNLRIVYNTWFEGILDEFQIYNISLNNTEIMSLYNSMNPLTPTTTTTIETTTIPTTTTTIGIIPIGNYTSYSCLGNLLMKNVTQSINGTYFSTYEYTVCEYNCSKTILGTRCNFSEEINIVLYIMIGIGIMILVIWLYNFIKRFG